MFAGPRASHSAGAGAGSSRSAFRGRASCSRTRYAIIPARLCFGAHADLEDVFAELEERGRSEFEAEQLSGFSLRSLDLRYQGQGYELNVPFGPDVLDAFHDLHRLRYGFAKEEHEVEVVNVRVRMVASSQPFDPARKADRPMGMASRRSRAIDRFTSRAKAHYTPVYTRAGAGSGRFVFRPGNHYGIQFGDDSAAGRHAFASMRWIT